MEHADRSADASSDPDLPVFGGVFEPATFLTDLLLGAVATLLGARLIGPGTLAVEPSVRVWGWALVAMGAGATLGGLSHGFGPRLPPAGRKALWKATLAALGSSSLLLLWSIAIASLDGPARTVVIAFAVVKLMAYLAWLARSDGFAGVLADHSPTMLIVLVLGSAAWAHGSPAGAWIVAGTLTATAGGLIQALRLSPGRWFNHNDLFHVVQVVAVWLYYEGGRRFTDLG